MHSIRLVAFACFAALSVCAQASEQENSSGPLTLQNWRSMISSSEPIRVRMVRDAAMSAAMRAGLTRQSIVINKMLDDNARYLDDIYDFSSLMLPNNVVPPVIRRVDNITEQEGDILRYSAVRFRIVKQAGFVTRVPSWRTYLKVPVWNETVVTHSELLPKNSEERAAAVEGLAKGWEAGAKQANDMFFKGLTRLDNDFLGMATYHALLKSNMVTLPKVLRTDVPVVGDGNTMTLDQSTYTIESKPVFNPQMMSWLALIDGNAEYSLMQENISKAESERINASVSSLEELQKAWVGN